MRNFETLKEREAQRGGPKKKKTYFVSWKAYFSSCYFFIIAIPLHLKDKFYSLK